MTNKDHPSLAELAERMLQDLHDKHMLNQWGPSNREKHETITAHLAPLYAELERLKTENEQLHRDLFPAIKQVGELKLALARKNELLERCYPHMASYAKLVNDKFDDAVEESQDESLWLEKTLEMEDLIVHIHKEIGTSQ